MTVPLPNVAEAINAGGPVSIAWRNWLESVNRALNDGSLSVSALQALVADLQAQVAALDAGSVRQGEGIALYGSLQDTLTIALRALDNSGAGALLAVTRDDFGRVSGTKPATITGTAGRVTVANGDAVAGLPTIDLATVADAGGGTLLRIVRDAWGRITGTSMPTTTDLAEGANLYHTTARARAAAVADAITDGVLDVAPSQNAVFDALALKQDDAAVAAIAGLSANQTLANATTTKVNLNTESVDTNGYFDTTNGRFTPGVAGLYQVVSTVSFVHSSGVITAGERIIAYVHKNGAQFQAVTAATHTSVTNNVQAVALVQMNGTTDYIEMYARRDTTAAYDINANGTQLSAIRLSA